MMMGLIFDPDFLQTVVYKILEHAYLGAYFHSFSDAAMDAICTHKRMPFLKVFYSDTLGTPDLVDAPTQHCVKSPALILTSTVVCPKGYFI